MKCECQGCDNEACEDSTYCLNCRRNIVYVDVSRDFLKYCKLHKSPPTKEDIVNYLIFAKTYKKSDPHEQTRGHGKKDNQV